MQRSNVCAEKGNKKCAAKGLQNKKNCASAGFKPVLVITKLLNCSFSSSTACSGQKKQSEAFSKLYEVARW